MAQMARSPLGVYWTRLRQTVGSRLKWKQAITVWASAPERMGLDPVHLYVDLFDEALAQAGEDSFVPIMRCLQFETRCRGEQNGFGQA